MIMDLGCFENEVIHCIENNPRNDNFSFDVRAGSDAGCLEILNSVNENINRFEEELTKIIGECAVTIDFKNVKVSVKRVNQKCYPCGFLAKSTGKCIWATCVKEKNIKKENE